MRLGPEVPALVAHPDWQRPAPLMLWMHGRTVHKELDPGRYLRWVRAGIAACAIDLPFHGERREEDRQGPEHTMELLERALGEVDAVLDDLLGGEHGALFDGERMGIGGMSAGGMVSLRRLCDEHRFTCAAVEATSGWLEELYFPTLEDHTGAPWGVSHERERVRRLDPMANLEHWRPIPLLALHTEADRIVPIAGQRAFLERLRERYGAAGADPALIELRTWPKTGAMAEHAGFGRFASEAKDVQLAFLKRCLLSDD